MISDLVIVALISAVPGSIAAVVGVINSIKASKIHVLVNSNYSEQIKKQELLQTKFEAVEEALVQSKIVSAGLLGAK